MMSPFLHDHAGVLYEKMGEPKKAHMTFEKALKYVLRLANFLIPCLQPQPVFDLLENGHSCLHQPQAEAREYIRRNVESRCAIFKIKGPSESD